MNRRIYVCTAVVTFLVTFALISVNSRNLHRANMRAVGFEEYKVRANEESEKQAELDKPTEHKIDGVSISIGGEGSRDFNTVEIGEILIPILELHGLGGVLGIDVLAPNRVHVWTGFVKGPLHGGGKRYEVVRAERGWRITRSISWVS